MVNALPSRKALLVEPARPASPAGTLFAAGFAVLRSPDPADAERRLLAGDTFDLVLCDIGYRHSQIATLFDAVKRDRPDCPTVLVSPDSPMEDAELGRLFGADDVLRIPVRRQVMRRPVAGLPRR